MDEKGDSAAASTMSPQSRSHKIKQKEKCSCVIACICLCVYVSLCVLHIKLLQLLYSVPRELLMCVRY